MGRYGRYISKIDSPTRAQTKKVLDQYRYEKHNGVLLPKYVKESLQNCQGCGHNMAFKKSEIYFDQRFCSECVEKWKAGY